MSKIKIIIGALVFLILFSLFLRTQLEKNDETSDVTTTQNQEEVQKDTEETDILDAVEDPDTNPPEDMRSTISPTEKNAETVVCPDDVFICTAGGNGEPTYTIELKRVPPSCDFPACPG